MNLHFLWMLSAEENEASGPIFTGNLVERHKISTQGFLIMSGGFRHNHYVPVWYQRRFMLPEQKKYWYLDLTPERIDREGHSWTRDDVLHWGPKRCFAEDDLYTIQIGSITSQDIEKFFFGRIDGEGKPAVEHFANFTLNADSRKALSDLLTYMSVQKLRTPKGLRALRHMTGIDDKNISLLVLQRLQRLFGAIWTECVWQIADASRSDTKFIISDHPVVVYNRACFPGSQFCVGSHDPDIRLVGTHTYFPLSLDKILILTNLSWVRNPYQGETNVRPNPELMRTAIFKLAGIQVDRFLTEEEVIEINYITKMRASRYIAAAEREWLYPEQRMRNTHWRKLGDGYLLMPEPRHLHGGGEVIIGYGDGTSDAFSPYGHRPWQKGFRDERQSSREFQSLERFKAEWCWMYGREYRGIVIDFLARGVEPPREMSEDYFNRMVEKDRALAKKPGERSRRRQLRR